MEFIESVKKFNELAGTTGEYDVRKSALYSGLILEEVAELLESLNHDDWQAVIEHLYFLSNNFKSGNYDGYFDAVDRKEFLDAAVDIMVVAAGAGIAIGADISGAADEVCRSNLSKYETESGDLVVTKDENGKIMKGPKYFKPQLEKYIKE